MELYPHQKEALAQMKNGCILCGSVGSGKSITALAYYYKIVCGGSFEKEWAPPKHNIPLFIITTAQKRDKLEWEGELAPFLLEAKIDSWQNIKKYKDVKDAFFIFDEDKVTGYGAWAKTFITISKNNKWIILSATPGDTWMDYVSVFIANGFYKNKTAFVREHVIYNRHTTFPKVDKYINQGKLLKYRKDILVMMNYSKKTLVHKEDVFTRYDDSEYKYIIKNKWNPYTNSPCLNISELCYVMRRLVNSDANRLDAMEDITEFHKRVIVFYNFNYELDLLRDFCVEHEITFAEWNGQKHEPIPDTDSWMYLVNYIAGAEGWNCIETNAMVFYSQNYSYKTMVQAAGRIDRLNTPYTDLYYYYIKSRAPIDLAISQALRKKKNFNESAFMKG